MDELQYYLDNQPDDLKNNATRLRRVTAYERLKDAIQNAALEPGEPLTETRLSELLGISRTPVREALQQLAQEGLVQVIPGRAITVAEQSVQDVLDVVHLRGLLEPELVRLATEVASHREIEQLKRAVAEMQVAIETRDHTAWSRADSVFHQVLGDACPNQLLCEVVLQMRNRVHQIANIDSQTNPARLAECTDEHVEIVEAMAARDSTAAEEAMRGHIDKLRESLLSRLRYG
jgi:DNA-binding GntR family transcriptional regulator